MIKPIWMDTFVTLNTNNSPVNYSINMDGEAIFYGKAWAAPSYNSDEFKTQINKICEDYLSNDFYGFASVPIDGMSFAHNDAVKTFVIKNEDTGATLDTVTFIYDWSYDTTVYYTEGKTTQMSHPINKRGKEGMYYFQTTFNGSKVNSFVSLTPINGYTEVSDCNSKWALYYINRYGGWDSYLIEGYVSRKDSFSRKNVVKGYDNNTLEFGNKPYLTEVTPTYEIHTGWMNDRESEQLAANVFQSTRLYLHNLETQEIIPIVITDADALYKNHKNSGRRLLNYTINAVASQTEHNKN